MAFCLTDYFKVQKEKAEGDLPNLSQIDYTSSKLNIFNMLNRIAGRSLFKTDKGYFGIGPPYMKQGDLVCAVDNCTIPVLLRKSGDVADDASFLEHVGNCYVSGLSDGEAADMVAKDGLEVQTFRIR
ncbi:hypothetical protein M426DRAFT_323511 [Hypoxylon sp. CI-4A]|nr:hypothetical protein M426DRAFT_323511 [Hypoxylon sp. CI-4A]